MRKNYHAIPLSYRWLRLWLVSFFAVGAVVAQTASNPSLQTSSAASGSFLATYDVSINANQQGVLFTWTYNTTTHKWRVVCVSGPSVGWASGTTLNYTGGAWTVYGQVQESLPNAAFAFGVNRGGPVSIMTLPASGPSESSQTVTVTPASSSVRVGQTVNLTASGGQNGYNWSATSGGSLAYDGANAGFLASTPATYIVQVWSPAGNGYSESNYASATITVTASEKVKVNLPANKGGRPIEYIFNAAGQTIGTETQNIGAAARVVEVTLPPSIPSGTPVTVLYKVVGIIQDEVTGSWSVLPGAVTQGTVTTVTPSTNPTTVGPDSPDFIGPKLPDGAQPTTGDQTGKPVWSSESTTGALTDAAYKEGVDKTTAALAKINKTLEDRIGSGSGGGGTGGGEEGNGEVSDTGTHDRLDSIAEKLDVEATRQQAALDANPAAGAASGAGATAGAAASSALPGGGSQPGAISMAKAEPSFMITMPAVFGGRAFDMNPFRSDRAGPVIDWVRGAIAWLVVVGFGVWASTAVAEWTRGASQINQAKGNAVVGGTGAQATALIAAAAITVAISTFVVALVGWLGGDIGFSAIVSALTVNPMSGAPATVAWMLDRCFPVATMVSALVARVSWNLYAAKIFAVAMSVIRFIVP